MSSIASVNPGVSGLLQTLSSAGSTPASSVLSSPKVESALQNASPGDIAQLSAEALQLQEANGLFGSPDSSQTAASIILQALNSSLSGSTTNSAPAPGSTALSSTAATAAAASELEQVSGLLGTNSNAAGTGAGNGGVSVLA
ncbi:MAG: hypothetical protein ABSG41_03180 [Bryobacteraceae bacterium]